MATSPNYGWLEPDNTDLVKNGALAIRTLGNAIDTTMATMTPKSIVDAKGDLIAASANDTPARLAVGANGETLVADSSTTTGLRYTGNYAAGKNAIINGDFRINQRAFTSNTTNLTYNFDRWAQINGGNSGTLTVTPQTFTPGAAPVAGYEAANFVQCVTASGASTNTFAILAQRIEDVRTYAGQTVTVSFWAKATSGTPKIAIEFEQNFGSGGSPSTAVTAITGGAVTLSTSFARYSVNVSVPSISGKTIGTTANTSFLQLGLWLSGGGDFNTRASSIGLQNNTFQIWGVQVEAGSVATAFQTATGTIQGELAACQRYYWRQTGSEAYGRFPGTAIAASTTEVLFAPMLPVTMRTFPSATLDVGNIAIYDGVTVIAVTAAAVQSGGGSRNSTSLNLTVSGATQFRPYFVITNNNTAGFIGYSAEL